MRFDRLARDYLRKALARRKALQVLYDEKSYDDVVREAQEAVELSLKGILRAIGVDPPKKHDVGGLLVTFKDRFPPKLQPVLGKIEEISKTLFEERGHAFYGDESSLVPASELFGKGDAVLALQGTDTVLNLFKNCLASH